MSMTTTLSDNIFSKCSAALSVDTARCDAVTGLDISATTPSDLTSIYKDSTTWNIIGALLEADFVGNACQIRTNGMFDLIQATKRNLGTKKLSVNKINNGLAELMPFIKMLRKGPINNEYWTATGGASDSSETPNGYTDADFTITVTSQGDMPADVRWFPRGMRVFINGVTAGGTTTHTAFKVADAAVDGTSIDLYLVSQNSNVIGPLVKHTLPTTGVLVRGTPNVSDYESYCAQIPGINTNALAPFWLETTRYSICEDDLYLKYINAIRQNNPLFKMFGDVESVELNRQIVEDFQRRHANAFFWNKPLANQTLANYGSLEQITIEDGDANSNTFWAGAKFIGRRANAVGVYWQMQECNRVFDLQGQPLNIPELQKALYTMQRIRKANGLDAKVFEILVDSEYALKLQQGLIRYFKEKGEGMLQLNLNMSAKAEQGPFGFYWRSFMLDYPMCELRIVTHDFFDDWVAAHKAASATLETPSSMMFILDWSTIYQAMIESSSVSLQSGDIQRLAETDSSYLCVMKVPKKRQKLFSQMYTNVVECPASSMIIENFDRTAVPEHEYTSGSDTDLYGNYAAND